MMDYIGTIPISEGLTALLTKLEDKGEIRLSMRDYSTIPQPDQAFIRDLGDKGYLEVRFDRSNKAVVLSLTGEEMYNDQGPLTTDSGVTPVLEPALEAYVEGGRDDVPEVPGWIDDGSASRTREPEISQRGGLIGRILGSRARWVRSRREQNLGRIREQGEELGEVLALVEQYRASPWYDTLKDDVEAQYGIALEDLPYDQQFTLLSAKIAKLLNTDDRIARAESGLTRITDFQEIRALFNVYVNTTYPDLENMLDHTEKMGEILPVLRGVMDAKQGYETEFNRQKVLATSGKIRQYVEMGVSIVASIPYAIVDGLGEIGEALKDGMVRHPALALGSLAGGAAALYLSATGSHLLEMDNVLGHWYFYPPAGALAAYTGVTLAALAREYVPGAISSIGGAVKRSR